MMKRAIGVFCLLIITVGILFLQNSGFPVFEAPYLGQEPPGKTPKLFAPGIVSTKNFDEYGCTFSPDGKEFYFSRRKGPYDVTILVTKQNDHGWTNPREASFSSGYDCVEPHYSVSGKKIFFQSTAPLPPSWNLPYNKTRFKLWIVERQGKNWGKPYPLDKNLSQGIHGQVSVSDNNTIYATYNSQEIVTLKYIDGKYHAPERIRFPLNDQSDVMVHPCIARDESYLIFCSGRSDGSYGKADLWVSFPREDGSWGRPINLGSNINTSASEGFPSLSYDGKYIFFDRNEDIYWVDVRVIEDLKPEELKR
jgi:Tol biopolymer transport system component